VAALSEPPLSQQPREDVYVVGRAWIDVDDHDDRQLDELIFDACSQALRDAGVRRHQIGFSVTSSLDLYDGRSISNALTAPAAAGYLNDELRVEGDASSSVVLAMAHLISGHADMAIVTAINVPEAGSTAEPAVRQLREHVSSYTFDSHMDRPVGMRAAVTLGMHAARRLDSGAVTWDRLVDRTTTDINRGAVSGRGRRSPVTADDVRSSPMAVAPLPQLMLPAESAGAGAVVLAYGVAARRCPRPLARLTGWGSATGQPPANRTWLDEPAAAAARAASKAYERAGLTDPSTVAGLEMTDLSPALSDELQGALQLAHLPDQAVNVSGGVRANHPGIASGLLRLVDAVERVSDGATGGPLVVHGVDDLMGLVSGTANVFVLEAS
jgi:acetyl-CoA acetyltransferase